MSPQEASFLERMDQKLDNISTQVTMLVVKEQALEDTVRDHKQDIATLKAAYNKALGVLAFLTLPGVATALWLGIQLNSKKP